MKANDNLKSHKIGKKTFFSFLAVLMIFTFGFANSACARDKTISLSDVSTPAKQFLSQHFGGVAIQKITIDTDDYIAEYDICLENGIKIDIDKNGNWEEISTRNAEIPAAVMPKAISSYLAQNYPSNKIVKIDKDNKGYEVKLSNNVELEFDANGNFVKIDR